MFSVRARLCLMMFLEIFIWGAWLPLIFGYLEGLHFTPLQQGLILNAFAICSITTLLFSTEIADRYFAAEKFLFVSHLIGGVAMLGLFFAKDFNTFLLCMFVHSFFYVPTISVANSISFANIKNSHEFGQIRLWGTIGWIAASWPFIFILADWEKIPAYGSVPFVTWIGQVFGNAISGEPLLKATSYAFIVSAVASILCAIVSITLPHTPPKPKLANTSMAWIESLKLLKHPFMLVLFIVTLLDASVHQCYFLWTGSFLKDQVGIPSNWVTPTMSVGQIAEIVTMAGLGYVLKTFGWKTTMIVGILGHFVRFGVFAFAPAKEYVIAVILLHGICYAFFFATVYIFVDQVFPKHMRSTAQGLFNLVILGFGPVIGNFLWPVVLEYFKKDGHVQYNIIFWFPSLTAGMAALFLLLFFHPPMITNETLIDPETVEIETI